MRFSDEGSSSHEPDTDRQCPPNLLKDPVQPYRGSGSNHVARLDGLRLLHADDLDGEGEACKKAPELARAMMDALEIEDLLGYTNSRRRENLVASARGIAGHGELPGSHSRPG
jgi:hypothetical protein